MKTFSAGKALDRTTARNCFLINQFATPGLGSLMGRRFIAGAGQLVLALIGFGLVVAWFVAVMVKIYEQVDGDVPATSAGWLGIGGAVIFAASWLWSLVTSLSLLREARKNEQVAAAGPKG